jgi:probable F420-dependent oxidoreductase
MTALRPFRFGVIAYDATSKKEWVAKARRIEQLGYSTLLVPDHLGKQLAPVLAILAAAEVTSSLRVGSYVFDNDFRHPVMLAKEAATLDVLTSGRFEFGIGAGYLRSEYEQAGMAYDAASVRVSRLEETIQVVKGLFAEEPLTFSGSYYTVNNLDGFPKPVQRPHPPLLVGGAGKRLLTLAAREASIVSIGTKAQGDGSGLDVTDTTPAATRQKVEWIRQAAGERFNQLELNVIIYAVVVTEDRRQMAQQLAERFKTTDEHVLTIPHCLIGTPDQISEDLQIRREQYGISYIAVFDEHSKAFAPVVARLAGT